MLPIQCRPERVPHQTTPNIYTLRMTDNEVFCDVIESTQGGVVKGLSRRYEPVFGWDHKPLSVNLVLEKRAARGGKEWDWMWANARGFPGAMYKYL